MKEESGKKSKKSNIVTAAFFAFSLVVVAVIAIMEFGGEKDRHLEKGSFNVLFLFCAIGCFLLALLCETLKYSYLLRGKIAKHRRSLGFSVAVIGKYYDNLTPAGAGGQGFQMYYLSSHGCDPGTSGGLPIIGFLGLQFAFVLIGIVTMIFGERFLEQLVAVRVTAIIGLVFYAFIPACIIFFAIAPKPLEAIVGWGTRMLGKIHIIKDPEATSEKAIHSLQSYTDALRAFGRSNSQIFIVFGLSLIYQLAFMCMPFFVLKFFGASMGFVECFCRVVYIYAAITIIFTPGNSGAAEASFYMVFDTLSGGAVFWGMLVWRALCYYSWIFLGAAIQIRDRLRKGRRPVTEKNKNYG
ncbi:MAG: flippase-like domain-containing protein [Parasporobacterium sp.]|nr:flippase-like domain-containing protein [Parasporobacterium sp.]